MRLLCDLEGESGVFTPDGGGAALVAFLSFAVSRGFGATHPLIALADRLHDVHHVRFGPLTTFYDVAEDDAEDRAKREMTWQPPGDLARALRDVLNAIESDPQCAALLRRAGAATLPAEALALAEFLEGLQPGPRVRLGYEL
jgi:hypothetical protein